MYRTIKKANAKVLFYNLATRETETVSMVTRYPRDKFEKELKNEGIDGNPFIMVAEWEEGEEKFYIDDLVFATNGEKLDKPNPSKVTATIKVDIVKVYLVGRFVDEFSEIEVSVKSALSDKEKAKQIKAAVSHDLVIRRFEKINEICDLYGMDHNLFLLLAKPVTE